MNRSKLESDIIILDDLLLKEQREIIAIENQLEVSELTTDGDDSYFDWRVRAISAINMKRALCNSIKRQSNYWNETLKKIKSKEKAELKKESIKVFQENIEQGRIDKAHSRIQHEKTLKEREKTKLKKEKEKTKRHQASEDYNLKVAGQFKKIIKEMLGDKAYITLIQKAERLHIESLQD